jgi:hypothetical protein
MVDLYQLRAAVFALARTFLHGTTKYDHVQRMNDSAFAISLSSNIFFLPKVQ